MVRSKCAGRPVICPRASLLAVDARQRLRQGASRRVVLVGPKAPGVSSVQGLGSDLRASKPILLRMQAPASPARASPARAQAALPLQDARPAAERHQRSPSPDAMASIRPVTSDGARAACLASSPASFVVLL